MKLKNKLVIIDALLIIALYGIPLLILWGCGVIPVGVKSIMFYVMMGVSIFAHLFWVISTYRKGAFVEDSMIFPQLKICSLILLLPYVNLIFYYIPFGDMKWYWIIVCIIDFLALVAYFIAYSLLSHVANKMSNSLKSHQSEKIEAAPTKSYENDDGDFFGSSARRK